MWNEEDNEDMQMQVDYKENTYKNDKKKTTIEINNKNTNFYNK